MNDNLNNLRKIDILEAHSERAHFQLGEIDRDRVFCKHYEVAGTRIHIEDPSPKERIGRVRGFGTHRPVTKDDCNTVFDILEQNNVTNIRFRVPPAGQEEEIRTWLKERGLKRLTFAAQWIVSTEPQRTVATSLAIQEIDQGNAYQFAQIVVKNYRIKTKDAVAYYQRMVGAPGFTCFMAFDGEIPAGTGAIYSVGDGCIVFYGTTIAPYRKQGLQQSMIGYRLNHARAAGLTWASAMTITNDRSSRNLRRQGFAKAWDEDVYGR